jgi:general secretion pathway protein N
VLASEPAPPPPPPPRKKEVEPPPLALVGTIASEQEGFGIFLDQSTKEALRLKIGEDFQGWKLLAIKGGQVTMEKDQQAAVLTLPPPGGQSAGNVQLIPVSAVGAPTPVARRH